LIDNAFIRLVHPLILGLFAYPENLSGWLTDIRRLPILFWETLSEYSPEDPKTG
jgi:hypothetical protein